MFGVGCQVVTDYFIFFIKLFCKCRNLLYLCVVRVHKKQLNFKTMNKNEKILSKVDANKDLQKNFKKLYSYDNEQFVNDAQRYIKAIKQGRMLCIIRSVSQSGMSRIMKFSECSEKKNGYGQHGFMNFNCLFVSLGFSEVREKDGFRIGGCGMDMVFHTNYTIIHNLQSLGFISKKVCQGLAQDTPRIL